MIVINRGCIWSLSFMDFLFIRTDKGKPQTWEQNFSLRENFMMHLCMILYQSRENIYGRVSQAVCVYLCTAMNACGFSLLDKKLLWWFKKNIELPRGLDKQHSSEYLCFSQTVIRNNLWLLRQEINKKAANLLWWGFFWLLCEPGSCDWIGLIYKQCTANLFEGAEIRGYWALQWDSACRIGGLEKIVTLQLPCVSELVWKHF